MGAYSLIQGYIQEDSSRAASLSVREGFVLQQEILCNMVLEALQQQPRFNDAALQESSASFSPLVFATTFYGLDTPAVPNYRPTIPLITAVEQLFALSQTSAKCLVQVQGSDANLRATYSHILFILAKLVEFADSKPDIGLNLSLIPSSWLGDMLDCLDMEVCS